MLEVGSIVGGRFRIDRILGQGGMGVVAVATHLQLDQQVAIKVLHEAMSNDADVVARLLREAQASARLRSDHVCKVFDVGRFEDGAPYIVMELLDGSDLQRVLSSGGPLPVAAAVDHVLQACVAIAEAHAHGIVHRDLKPANLFLTRRLDGSPLIKVLDFGIAKAPAADEFKITRTSVVMGSPGYMSPEQLRSAHDVDARSDIWALGVILYELVSGRLPFRGNSITEIAVKVTVDPPEPLDIDAPEFAAVVLRCLEKSAGARYPTVAELAAALAPFGGDIARHSAMMIAVVAGASTAPGGPATAQVASARARAGMPSARADGAPPPHAASRPTAATASWPGSAPASFAPAAAWPPTAATGHALAGVPPPTAAMPFAPPSAPPPTAATPFAPPSAPPPTAAMSFAPPSAPPPTAATPFAPPSAPPPTAATPFAPPSAPPPTAATPFAPPSAPPPTAATPFAPAGALPTPPFAATVTTLQTAAAESTAGRIPMSRRSRAGLVIGGLAIAAVIAAIAVFATRDKRGSQDRGAGSAGPTMAAAGTGAGGPAGSTGDTGGAAGSSSGAPAGSAARAGTAATGGDAATGSDGAAGSGAAGSAATGSDQASGSDAAGHAADSAASTAALRDKLRELAAAHNWSAVLEVAELGRGDPEIAAIARDARQQYVAQQGRAIDGQVKQGNCARAKDIAAAAHKVITDDAKLEARARACKPLPTAQRPTPTPPTTAMTPPAAPPATQPPGHASEPPTSSAAQPPGLSAASPGAGSDIDEGGMPDLADAQSAVQRGDWQRALSLAQAALRQRPRSPIALRLGVISACHLHDERTARSLLRRVPLGRQRALRQACAAQDVLL